MEFLRKIFLRRKQNEKIAFRYSNTCYCRIAYGSRQLCRPRTQLYRPKGTPAIDGTAEELWDNAEWTNVDLPFGDDDDDYDGHALRVKLLWDEEAVYLLGEFSCKTVDTCVDIIEFYIDENGVDTGDFEEDVMQVGFSMNGVEDDNGVNNRSDDCEAVSVKTGTGFLCEAKIKWSGEVAHKEGGVLGLEFMANIQPDGSFVQAFRWNVDTANGDTAPYQSTEYYGDLILGPVPAPAVVEVEEAPATEAPTAAETPAAQTADMISVAVLLAAAALGAGVIISKKHRA